MVILWAVIFLVTIGVGKLVVMLLGIENEANRTLFWLGLTLVVGWLFLAHLIAPLGSAAVSAPLLVAGVAGWMGSFDQVRDCRDSMKEAERSSYLIPLACLLVVALLANLALSEPTNYDSFLYHFASIKHHSDYAAIEGIANLHYRLGFHTATIPLAALFDLWPFGGEGYRVINGLLLSALVIELGGRVTEVSRDRKLKLGTAFLLLVTPVYLLVPGAADPSAMIASPSLDTGAGVTFIVAFTYFLDALTVRTSQAIAVSLLLLALAATFRQLNLVLLATAGPLLIVVGWKAGLHLRALVRPLFLTVLVTLSAAIHSTVLSGYPFYPATFPNLNLPWAHPVDEANGLRDDITQFARGTTMDPIGLTDSLRGTLSWLESWIRNLRGSGQLPRLALLSLVSLAGAVAIAISGNRWSGLRKLALVMFPLLVVLAFWFVSAPLIRFGLGPLAATFAAPVALALLRGRDEIRISWKGWAPSRDGFQAAAAAFVAGLALILFAASLLAPGGGGLVKADGSGALGSRPPVAVEVRRTVVQGGVTLSSPVYRDWCGKELWCTPYPSSGIKLRGSELSDGLERLNPKDEKEWAN
ncbi:MAG: hypothetical protein WEB05_03295, partial [Solirubrobacterales bacterium]